MLGVVGRTDAVLEPRVARRIQEGDEPARSGAIEQPLDVPLDFHRQQPLPRVRRFWEKPPLPIAHRLMGAGCMWNSFVIVARLSAFLGLFLIAMPELFLQANIAGIAVVFSFRGTFRRILIGSAVWRR